MTISEEMKAQGWIEHDGGPCPVPPDSQVTLMFDSGTDNYVWTASKVIWPHNAFIYEIGEIIPHDCRVIAYRPETPDA